MHFSVKQSSLFSAIQKVESVVQKKNTIQILGSILCEAKGNKLSLFATDLEIGVSVTIPSIQKDVSLEKKFTIPSKQLLEIVRELPEKDIFFSLRENDWVKLTCGKSEFNFVTLPAIQYPILPNLGDKSYVKCFPDRLLDMIDRTIFAASDDASRYQINGIYLENVANHLTKIVATDRHRLSFIEQEVFHNLFPFNKSVILPKKGVAELKKLLMQRNEEVGMSFESGYLFVHSQINDEEVRLFIHALNGEYPDYRSLIPESLQYSAILDRSLFLSALKRVSLFTTEKNKFIRLFFRKGTITILSSSSEIGEAREEIDLEYEGEDFEIGFNPRYISECLSVMKSEKIRIRFQNESIGVEIAEIGNLSHICIVMPVRMK